MSTGKKLEALIKKACVEQGVDFTRLRDAGFMRSEKSEHKRFTPKNICDCILFYRGVILFAEIKHRNGALRFDEITQLPDLEKKWKPEEGVYSGVICQLKGNMHFVPTSTIVQMKRESHKKSFNSSDAGHLGLNLHMFTPPRKRTERPNMMSLMDIVPCLVERIINK